MAHNINLGAEGNGKVTATITVRLKPEEKQFLQAYAETQNMTISQAVRFLIRKIQG